MKMCDDKKMHIPRILISGTSSGCGKTTVASAVIKALVNRGLKVGTQKCGPDYIDPMFHAAITGDKGSNLDSFFFDDETLRFLLQNKAKDKDINIIEGAMGFYDGIGMSEKGSAYDISKRINCPAVLTAPANGASLSTLALIDGFISFYPDNLICGVILNRCTPGIYEELSKEIKKRFKKRVLPLGFMPYMPKCSLESRHLGLVTAREVDGLNEKLKMLSCQAEKSIDLDAVIKLANEAEPLDNANIAAPRFESVRIGVARDEAFCFYYEDSLSLLECMGAELVDFSPLHDKKLPEGICGLYLGGGYPELYAQGLCKNTSMLISVKSALSDRLPCIAECGGFMYLTKSIGEYPMAGFFDGKCFDTGRLSRFGYIELTAKHDNMLCRKGEKIRAHEFHYWDCGSSGDSFEARKPSGRVWSGVFATDRLYAGYPHFHFYSNIDFAVNFYKACLEEKHKNDRKHRAFGN